MILTWWLCRLSFIHVFCVSCCWYCCYWCTQILSLTFSHFCGFFWKFRVQVLLPTGVKIKPDGAVSQQAVCQRPRPNDSRCPWPKPFVWAWFLPHMDGRRQPFFDLCIFYCITIKEVLLLFCFHFRPSTVWHLLYEMEKPNHPTPPLAHSFCTSLMGNLR